MEDLFKGFAEELEERKLEKASIGGQSFPTPFDRPKLPKKTNVGHKKDVATKRKEIAERYTEEDTGPDGEHKNTPRSQVYDMHEDNLAPHNTHDDDIHEYHEQIFPEQY